MIRLPFLTDAPKTLTIVIPIGPRCGDYRALYKLLRVLGNDERGPIFAGLRALGTVHWARLVVLRPERDPDGGALYGPVLAFESNHDDGDDEHIEALSRELGRELDPLLRHCVGYDAAPTDASRAAYLRAHQVTTDAPYCGHPNLPARVVASDRRLRAVVRSYVEEERAAGRLPETAQGIHQAVRDHVAKRHPELLVKHARAIPSRALFWVTAGALALAVPLGLAAATSAALSLSTVGFAVAFGGLALFEVVAVVGVYLDFKSRVVELETLERPASDAARADVLAEPDRRMAEIFASEDRQTQNPLTHVAFTKDDPRRLAVLKTVLFALRFLAKTYYVHGKLGPIDSIHCARWVLIDGGKRVLFFSNYDGTWESYLGEFVDKLAFWLSAVWSNTKRFPTTVDMFEQGARDEEWFKRWTRARQHYTHLWYAAYPNMSVQNVIANAELREGLHETKLSDKALRTWLRLL